MRRRGTSDAVNKRHNIPSDKVIGFTVIHRSLGIDDCSLGDLLWTTRDLGSQITVGKDMRTARKVIGELNNPFE
jgi:hypothetical protein